MDVSRNTPYVFYVDMNALKGDQIGTLLTLASDPIQAQVFPPSPGDVVLVRDDEDDLYEARVDIVDGIWLGLTIDWSAYVPTSTTTEPYRQPVVSGIFKELVGSAA